MTTASGDRHCLVFELDSIQQYLFSSGRMRDLIGASELLDRLTGRPVDDASPFAIDEGDKSLLGRVCLAAGVGEQVEFSRRSGGAFYAFSDQRQALERLRDLWTLAIQQAAPHLSYTLGLGSGENSASAFKAARQAQRHDASRYRVALPVAAPVAERSRRTGLPGVDVDRSKGGVIDAAVARHRQFADMSVSTFLERFTPSGEKISWRQWPRLLQPEPGSKDDEVFPFKGEQRRLLALIHADGNGLGKILQQLNQVVEEKAGKDQDVFVDLYQGFSSMVDRIARHAAGEATRQVLLPCKESEGAACLPARPILLAGDDITILVRADLAMDYVCVFIRAFEEKSRRELAELRDRHGIEGLPERLTLGVGMVYMGVSRPFHLVYELAEALTAEAKKRAKAVNESDPDASIVFHRVTGTLIDDYDALVRQALTHVSEGKRYIDTLGAYFFDGGSPRLAHLLGLTELLGDAEMARGPTRELLTLMGLDHAQAKRRYRRWRQVMKKDKAVLLKRFDDYLEQLGVQDQELPYLSLQVDGSEWRTPLGDVLALLGAGHERRLSNVDGQADKEDAA